MIFGVGCNTSIVTKDTGNNRNIVIKSTGFPITGFRHCPFTLGLGFLGLHRRPVIDFFCLYFRSPSTLYTSIESQCHDGCLCDDNTYFPICGEDGQSYYSPCHAGCSNQNKMVGASMNRWKKFVSPMRHEFVLFLALLENSVLSMG